MEELVINNIENQRKSAASAPLLAPDLDDFRSDLADLRLTEDQETEILEILWSIMGHFARLGYSVDVCGLIFTDFNEASAPTAADGKLSPSTNMESASKPDGGSA